jgi:hypothetical protein
MTKEEFEYKLKPCLCGCAGKGMAMGRDVRERLRTLGYDMEWKVGRKVELFVGGRSVVVACNWSEAIEFAEGKVKKECEQ